VNKVISVITIISIAITSLIPTQLQGYSDFIQEKHPNIPSERAEALSKTIRYYGDRYDVPSDIIVAIMWQESQFRNRRSNVDVNPCSAGYLQVQRTTASLLYHQELSCDDLIVKWRLNIELGVRYLRKMYDETGHLSSMIGRYNGVNNPNYVKEVIEKYQTIRRRTN